MKNIWDFLTTDKPEYAESALYAIIAGVVVICIIVGRAYFLTGALP